MLKNVGAIDRNARVVIGLVLVSLIFIGPQTAWGLVGLVFIVTGLSGFCPLYRLLKVNTCAHSK